MILNNNGTNVTSIGNIQKNQVSIDAKNINHIVTILSSNLYSKPQESFLRETVSNAIDSHIEAGVKEPVIITISDKSLAIRDYGTGISPERFQEIYLNIGSSTKRESNDYIGSFGIGRFSALSVSNLVNVTSYYEGKAYCYLMVKDATKLSIDLINTYDTDEHNGVEVKVPIKPDEVNDYIKLLYTLAYFPNIYINLTAASDKSYKVKEFNDRKIYKYTNFKYCNVSSDSYNARYILVGNVLYKIDTSILSNFYRGNYKNFFDNIIPVFNIGDLDITPNRESILYSDRSKKKINEVLQACQDECYKMLCDKYKKDYDDALEYLFYEEEESYKTVPIGDIEVSMYYSINILATYKGINYKEYPYKTYLSYLCSKEIQAIATWERKNLYRGKSNKDSLFRLILNRSAYHRKFSEKCNILCVPNANGFSSKYLKGYLEEYLGDKKYLIIETPNVNYEFNKFFSDNMYIIGNTTKVTEEQKRNMKIFFIGILKSLKKITTFEDVMHSDAYIKYKKESSAEEKKYHTFSNKVTYYVTKVFEYYSRTISYKASSVEDIVKTFNTFYKDKIWVYAHYDDDRSKRLCKFYGDDRIAVLQIAKANWKLTDNLPPRFKYIDDIYSVDNPKIQKAATCKYIEHHGKVGLVDATKCLYKYLPAEKRKKCLYFLTKYKHVNYDDIYDNFPKEKMDVDLIEGYKCLVTLQNSLQYLADIHQYINTNELFAYIGMKRKLFRISYNVYQKIKSLNLKLC